VLKRILTFYKIFYLLVFIEDYRKHAIKGKAQAIRGIFFDFTDGLS